MKITRTANAGVLIETMGVRILIDGVCQELAPYEKTPDSLREEFLTNPPDVLLFTHTHKDHYDSGYARYYKEKTLRPVCKTECESEMTIGGARIKSFPTRHIGKNDVSHASFVIEGDRCVWFAGDASPSELKGISEVSNPDILIVPYAYTITESGWRVATNTGAEKIVLLHLPQKELDEYSLWDLSYEVTKGDERLVIPEIGEELCF